MMCPFMFDMEYPKTQDKSFGVQRLPWTDGWWDVGVTARTNVQARILGRGRNEGGGVDMPHSSINKRQTDTVDTDIPSLSMKQNMVGKYICNKGRKAL